MDSYHQLDLLLLDFSKAFDTVAHNKLLLKLALYGIEFNMHQWIATWLTTRIQKGIVEGEKSKDKRVLCQECHMYVQRAVLGSFMFLMALTQAFAHLSAFLLMIV